MAGYSLLPTLDAPTSNLTYRLTGEEKQERDEWMVGAQKHGMSISEIASEVGLSVQHTTKILKDASKVAKAPKARKKMVYTPRDVALNDFEANRMHPECRNPKEGEWACIDCFGMMSIVESEYDKDGWPYDWAMGHGQEDYIAAAKAARRMPAKSHWVD